MLEYVFSWYHLCEKMAVQRFVGKFLDSSDDEEMNVVGAQIAPVFS